MGRVMNLHEMNRRQIAGVFAAVGAGAAVIGAALAQTGIGYWLFWRCLPC